jgi:ribose 5-phosphate isomerase RpiB
LAIVEAFLNTDFEGGRHANRVNKISINQWKNYSSLFFC